MMKSLNLLLVAGLAAFACACSKPAPKAAPPKAAEPPKAAAANAQDAGREAAGEPQESRGRRDSEWVYYNGVDGGVAVRSACVKSTEKVDLGSDYNEQYARICLRETPQAGHDAFLDVIDQGEFECEDTCEVTIRNGSGTSMRLPGAGSNQGNRDVIFFDQGVRQDIERAVRRNNTLRITAEFRGVGRRTMEFNTAGYNDDWIDTDTRTDQDR